jgi:flagellar motor switch protein FliM
MSNEVLSQDEVDALLSGVDDAIAPAATAEAASTIQPIDLLTQEHAGKARMPALELINERFCRLLRSAMFKLLGRIPEIAGSPVQTMKFAAFTAALPKPSNLNIAQLKPLRGSALFAFEPALVYLVVDNLFGGDGRFEPRGEGRDCTPTEQGIIQRILAVIFDEYEKAWKDVYPLRLEFLRSEANPQCAGVASPEDVVVAMKFTIGSGIGNGAFHICIPYSALDPIRDLVQGTGQTKERVEPDQRWLGLLSREVQSAEVELVADLITVPVTVKQLLGMTVGDILSVNISDIVTARVDGVPIFDCRFGTLNGQYALRIASVLTPEREPLMGANHG